MKIRRATIKDIEKLRYIGKRTFEETFSSVNKDENMNQYLNEAFSSDKLTSELLDEGSEFYFAELNENVIGYLKVNRGLSQTALKNGNALEIERIYVLKEFHGRKIGQALFDKALEIAKQLKVDYIWLGVWEKNLKAIRFYEKNGFVAFNKHIFKLGDEAQTDIMMTLNLKYDGRI